MTWPARIGLAALATCGLAFAALAAAAPRQSARPALAAVSVDLPADDPGQPHDDILVQHCTACHSAAMIDTQPVLTRDGWAAVVRKMREVYKAPIEDADVPAILDQLTGVSAAHQTGN